MSKSLQLVNWLQKNGEDITHPLYKKALTHRSFSKDNNERLEFLGDAVLDTVISKMLYEQYSKASEGQLSRYRALLVEGSMLAEIAKVIGLPGLIRLGVGERKSGGMNRESILAGAFEAVIGAIYLNCGLSLCEDWVLLLYQHKIIDLEKLTQLKDAKTTLQEFCQQRFSVLPQYTVENVNGQAHQQEFEVLCQIPDQSYKQRAIGHSKKSAEQAAAEKMLQQLKGK